jgi:hypothetical protein
VYTKVSEMLCHPEALGVHACTSRHCGVTKTLWRPVMPGVWLEGDAS